MKVRIQCSTVELSMGQCFKQIISEHGFRGLYRGMLTPLMFATPVSALAFSGNGWAQNNFLKNDVKQFKPSATFLTRDNLQPEVNLNDRKY